MNFVGNADKDGNIKKIKWNKAWDTKGRTEMSVERFSA